MRYHLQVATWMTVREIIVTCFFFCFGGFFICLFLRKISQMGLHVVGYHFKDPNKGKTEQYMRYIYLWQIYLSKMKREC